MCRASCFHVGASFLQWPHHGAKNLTNAGPFDRVLEKVSPESARTSPVGLSTTLGGCTGFTGLGSEGGIDFGSSSVCLFINFLRSGSSRVPVKLSTTFPFLNMSSVGYALIPFLSHKSMTRIQICLWNTRTSLNTSVHDTIYSPHLNQWYLFLRFYD